MKPTVILNDAVLVPLGRFTPGECFVYKNKSIRDGEVMQVVSLSADMYGHEDRVYHVTLNTGNMAFDLETTEVLRVNVTVEASVL